MADDEAALDEVLSDAEYEAATRQGAIEASKLPVAVRASFHAPSGRLVVDFENGAVFMVPARMLQDLEEASDEALADVSIELGRYLRWEQLDVDFTIRGLMAGIFGTAHFMDARRRASSVGTATPPPAGRKVG